jgi:hypothetical protein
MGEIAFPAVVSIESYRVTLTIGLKLKKIWENCAEGIGYEPGNKKRS